MSSISDKQAISQLSQDNRRKDHERLCQQMAEVFGTEAGQEILKYLVQRFDLLGRTFIATDRGDVNALRAAVRDGERAVVAHLLQTIRKAKPDFNFPL
jgi:hypothetical protein